MKHSNDSSRIDLQQAYRTFSDFLAAHAKEKDPGFDLKISHTYRVAALCAFLCEEEGLNQEERDLGELIGLLHDIGRFEEIRVKKDGFHIPFDHAEEALKILDDEWLRRFIREDCFDGIIREAVLFHNRFSTDGIQDQRTRLYADLLRDADKIDNLRLKAEEQENVMFVFSLPDQTALNDSFVSEDVMDALMNQRCVRLKDRKTKLDFYVTVMGFFFDLHTSSARRIVQEERYEERLYERINPSLDSTKKQMDRILRSIQSAYIAQHFTE